jgi:hypothetical protein
VVGNQRTDVALNGAAGALTAWQDGLQTTCAFVDSALQSASGCAEWLQQWQRACSESALEWTQSMLSAGWQGAPGTWPYEWMARQAHCLQAPFALAARGLADGTQHWLHEEAVWARQGSEQLDSIASAAAPSEVASRHRRPAAWPVLDRCAKAQQEWLALWRQWVVATTSSVAQAAGDRRRAGAAAGVRQAVAGG